MVDTSSLDHIDEQSSHRSMNQSIDQLNQSSKHAALPCQLDEFTADDFNHSDDQSMMMGSTDDSAAFDWIAPRLNDELDQLIELSRQQSNPQTIDVHHTTSVLPTPRSTRDRRTINQSISQFNFQPKIPSNIPIARNYAHIASSKPSSYTDYINRTIEWSSSDAYSIIARIGHGNFSEVFLASRSNDVSHETETSSITYSMEQMAIDHSNAPSEQQPNHQAFQQLVPRLNSPSNVSDESDRTIDSDAHFDDDQSIDSDEEQLVAIKLLKSIDQSKIRREIHMLQTLSFSSRVVALIDTVHDHRSDMHSLVLELLNVDNTIPCFHQLNSPSKQSTDRSFDQSINQSINLSMYDSRSSSFDRFVHLVHELLLAVNDCHSAGVMHRDLKPGNLAIDEDASSVKLLDLGISDFYFPHRAYPTRVASRYYKAPELLCDYYYYSYAVDMWAVGVIIAQWMTGAQLFTGEDTEDQMRQIVERFIGMKAFRAWVAKYEIELSDDMEQQLNNCDVDEPKGWHRWINESNRHLCAPDVLDLLNKLLDIDHNARLTVTEALSHPLFERFAAPDLAVTQPNSARTPQVLSPSHRWSY